MCRDSENLNYSVTFHCDKMPQVQAFSVLWEELQRIWKSFTLFAAFIEGPHPESQGEHSTAAVPGWRWPVRHSSSPAPGWSCSEGYWNMQLWARGRALWLNEDHWNTGKVTGRAFAAPWGDGQTVQWSENTKRTKLNHVIYLFFSPS